MMGAAAAAEPQVVDMHRQESFCLTTERRCRRKLVSQLSWAFSHCPQSRSLLYSPIVTHLSRGLVSAYVKADIRKRFAAAAIDGLMVVTAWLFFWTAGSVMYIVIGATYLLLRDAIGG